MSSEVTAALVSALISAVISLGAMYFTYQAAMRAAKLGQEAVLRQIAAEDRRWAATRLLERKHDALNELYIALVECFETLSAPRAFSLEALKQYNRDLAAKYKRLRHTKILASIYLEKGDLQVIQRAYEGLEETILKFRKRIFLLLQDNDPQLGLVNPDEDLAPLEEPYAQALASLQRLLNPETLRANLDSK